VIWFKFGCSTTKPTLPLIGQNGEAFGDSVSAASRPSLDTTSPARSCGRLVQRLQSPRQTAGCLSSAACILLSLILEGMIAAPTWKPTNGGRTMKGYLRKMKGYLFRKEGLYIGAVLLVYVTYEYLSEKAAICVGLAVLLFGFLILGQFLFDIARGLGNELETLKYNEFQTLIKMDAIHDKIDGIQGTLDDMRYAEQPLNDKIDAIKTLLDKTLKYQIDTIYELIPVSTRRCMRLGTNSTRATGSSTTYT
jgi:hypothetical protein